MWTTPQRSSVTRTRSRLTSSNSSCGTSNRVTGWRSNTPGQLSLELSDTFAALKEMYGRTLGAIVDGDLSAAADVDEEARPAFRTVAVDAAAVDPDELQPHP
jgi:hypothetical protein